MELGHFFRGAGITILEGWGLTETTSGVTLNLPAGTSTAWWTW
jgi:long-chain acyl-CoA synthetase